MRRDEWVERSVPRGLHPLDEARDDMGPPSARTCEAYAQPRQDFEVEALLVGVPRLGRAPWGHASSRLVLWPPGPELLFEKTFPTRVKMSWYSAHLEHLLCATPSVQDVGVTWMSKKWVCPSGGSVWRSRSPWHLRTVLMVENEGAARGRFSHWASVFLL